MFRFRFVLIILIVAMPAYTVSAPNVSELLREGHQEVLKIEPTNAKALAGLEKIEARYVNLAEFDGQLQPASSVASKPSNEQVASEPSTESVTPSQADKSVISSKPTEPIASQPTRAESTPPAQTGEPVVSQLPIDESATPSSINEEPPPPRKAQITDVGQIYELINTTECLKWPSPEMKEKGGKNGWGEFYPKKGDTGIIVKEMQHCHLEDKLYIVEIEEYYVPISNVGVKIMDEKSASTDGVEVMDEKPASTED
ncbi:MAG: hypothetical protein KAI83_17200 [Thiomargarita sp.]|nr:hypothetical protein [Thiomargarita sp.]